MAGTKRYWYCIVDTETTNPDSPVELPAGIEDEPVRLLRAGYGAVVHSCESTYDSAERTVMARRILRHQSVIDAARERFGTPIPCQFDTVVPGDDDTVGEWLREHRAALEEAFASVDGAAEYRIEVTQDEADLVAALENEDDRLADLDERIESASPGTRHLLERQYDERLTTLRQQRRDGRTDALVERVESLVRDYRELDRERSSPLVETADSEPVQARLAVLASDTQAENVGTALDDVAAEAGVEVRFTGPWPPYAFVPQFF